MAGHPVYFRHDEKDVEIAEHVDDGTIAGPSAKVTEIKQTLEEKRGMKDLGDIDEHDKNISGRSSRKPPTLGTKVMKTIVEWKQKPGTKIWIETVTDTIGRSWACCGGLQQ